MSTRNGYTPRNEVTVCPDCESRLKVMRYDNCVDYTCSSCDYKNTVWKSENKPKGPSKPKPRAKDHILDESKIKRVRGACENDLERFALNGMLYSGMRCGEFIHMRKSWVDFKKGFITIPNRQKCNCMNCRQARRRIKNLEREPTSRHKIRLNGFWTPKTNTSARKIPIVPELEEQLKYFFEDHKEVLEVLLATSYVNKLLNKLKKKTNIKLFPHALRSTYATILAKKGFTPFEIQQALGWKSVNQAMSYIKLSGQDLKKSYTEKW